MKVQEFSIVCSQWTMFRRDYCAHLGQQLVKMCRSYSQEKEKKKEIRGTGMHVLGCHKDLHFFFSMHTYVQLKCETRARREHTIGMRVIMTTNA